MATGGNAGDAPFMKQAPLPSREGKFYASEGCNSCAKILPGSVYPEIHPSKGNVGDAPGMKQSPGEGKLHTVQIWASPASYTGGDPKTLPGGDRLRTLSGDHPEAISGCDHPEAISGGGHPDTLSGRGRPDTLAGNDHPTTLAGVGPTIKSGGLMLAGGDPMVAAGYFSKIYTMAVKPPVLIHVPRTEPIVLQSPRDNVGINQLRNFIKRTILRRLVERERLVNKRERLVEKREDRAERHEQRVEKREIRADEKETANHATALGLEQERKKIQEDKEQHSLSLQQDRKKFDEDQKAAIVALEEERRKLEEHKVKVSQRAAEQGQEEEPKGQAAKGQDKGQSALIVSKVETADSRLGLVEKLIDIPKRKQAIMKSIRENVDIVKNHIQRGFKEPLLLQLPLVSLGISELKSGTFLVSQQESRTEARRMGLDMKLPPRGLGLDIAGVSNGGPKNGTGHEAASTGAGTGHEAASASTGAGAGNEAASASTGAGAGNEAASTGAGSGVKAV